MRKKIIISGLSVLLTLSVFGPSSAQPGQVQDRGQTVQKQGRSNGWRVWAPYTRRGQAAQPRGGQAAQPRGQMHLVTPPTATFHAPAGTLPTPKPARGQAPSGSVLDDLEPRHNPTGF